MDEPLRIAKYLRVSNEDDADGESSSIAGQRLLLDAYLKRMGWASVPVAEFIDDGLTGTSFERPGFQAMMQAIRRRQIGMVVIKDFSRLGRDYIETGSLIEQFFPLFGVRLVSVNDQYDSDAVQDPAGDVNVVLKNLANYFYSRDLSQKVKSANLTLMKQGRRTASDTIYGYRKDPEHKGKLLVDPEAAAVIQRVYRLFFAGTAMSRIAVLLNTEGVPTPAEYKARQTGRLPAVWDTRRGQKLYWTNRTVRNILTEERYTGTDILGKRTVKTVGSRRMAPLPPGQWIRIESHHEPIVPQETFERAQALLHTGGKQFGKGDSPFTGTLRCGTCGKRMVRAGGGRKRPTISCETPYFLPSANCSADRVPMAVIETTALNAIRFWLPHCWEPGVLTRMAETLDAQAAECRSMLRREARLAQRLKAGIRGLYEDWKEEKLTEAVFVRQKSSRNTDLQSIAARSLALQQKLQRLEARKQEYHALQGGLPRQAAGPAKELVQAFFSRILIYDRRHLEIVWNFSPPPVFQPGREKKQA